MKGSGDNERGTIDVSGNGGPRIRVFQPPVSIEKNMAAFQSALARTREPLTCFVGNTACAAELVPGPFIAAQEIRWLEAAGSRDSDVVSVCAGELELKALVKQLEPFWRPTDLDSADVVELVCFLLDDFVSTMGLQARFEAKQDLGRLLRPLDSIEVFGGAICALDVRVPFIMRLTEQAAIPLAERWMRRPLRHKRLPSLLVGVAISCGQTNLEQGELYSLRVGDAIRLDAASDLNHPHQLIVRDCVIAVASLAGSKVTVGRLLAKAFLENRGMAMTFNNSDSVADPLVSVGSLSNLQVPVRFEVGRIDLPLSELETMGAGYVFELGRTPVGIVDIVAGGRWIGRGELIDVDGRSAVRLLSLTK